MDYDYYNDFYSAPSGFPINKNAFRSMFEIEKENLKDSERIRDEDEAELFEKDYSYLLEKVSSVNKIYRSDSRIDEIIEEQLPKLIREEQTAEETAENIQKQVEEYLKSM